MQSRNMSERPVLAASFRDIGDAESALRDLSNAGFRADQIGVTFGGAKAYEGEESSKVHPRRRTFWQEIGDFFKGTGGQEERIGISSYSIPDAYRNRLTEDSCLITVSAEDRMAEAEDILIRDGGEIDREFVPLAASQEATEGQQRIQLLSEVLRVEKERVSKGEVRLRKEVTTERQTVEVPVEREEIVIERVPVEGAETATGEIGANREIRVPLSEEKVKVEKRPVVTEEVRAGKKVVQDTKAVSDDVKQERLKVEKEGDVDVPDEPKPRKAA
jgi:uncharacterized protein (TIGR02271 family)